MYNRIPVTIITVLVTVFAYLVELELAGSTSSHAAGPFLNSSLDNYQLVVLLLSPILHSSHNHIIQNLMLFIPFSYFVESRVDSSVFFLFWLIVGYLGAFCNVLVEGSIGVGISGIMYGVVAREANFRIHSWKDSESGFQELKHGIIWALAMTIIAMGIGQTVGILPVATGTAKTAHVVGIVVGFIWSVFDLETFILKHPHL